MPEQDRVEIVCQSRTRKVTAWGERPLVEHMTTKSGFEKLEQRLREAGAYGTMEVCHDCGLTLTFCDCEKTEEFAKVLRGIFRSFEIKAHVTVYANT